jgi:hypothetical protein
MRDVADVGRRVGIVQCGQEGFAFLVSHFILFQCLYLCNIELLSMEGLAQYLRWKQATFTCSLYCVSMPGTTISEWCNFYNMDTPREWLEVLR